ncbi:MAG: hypothetical protein QOD77_1888 [Thermoplasmata archaeon]|jgi:hypothetical protein|nr:hypothetical protein [Thermoplasmata archaeon]
MPDIGQLKDAAPDDIALFLKAQGWVAAEKDGFMATWLRMEGKEVVEHIAVPLRPQARDYPALLAMALKSYANFEGAVLSEVFDDVFVKHHDVVRVRLQGGVHDKGRAKLGEAADMVRGVRNMFFAGAAAVEKRQPVFLGRSTDRVERYLDSLEIATPERGSFVVKVFAPLAANLDEFAKVAPKTAEEPFSRVATTNMVRSVEAVVVAAKDARQKGNIEVFKDHIEEGVNANLCEALAHIAASSPLVSVSLGASWASGRPAPAAAAKRVVVPSEFMSLIEEAGPVLRGRHPEEPVTVVGLVFLLKEEKKAGVHGVGIGNQLAEGPRKVRVTLNQAQYKRAIAAHHADALVKVVGQVKRKGPMSYIDEPLSFEVIGQAPEAAENLPTKAASRKLDQF